MHGKHSKIDSLSVDGHMETPCTNKIHETTLHQHFSTKIYSVNNAARNGNKHTSRTCHQTKICRRSNRRSKLLPRWHRWHCHCSYFTTITCIWALRLPTSRGLFNGDLRTWGTCNVQCVIQPSSPAHANLCSQQVYSYYKQAKGNDTLLYIHS